MATTSNGRERAIAALSNDRIMAALRSVATKHLTAERIVRMIVGEFSRNPKLADCDPKTLVLCALSFSQLGLEPGLLGKAYMVPFKNTRTGKIEATFILGYKGKIDLAYRSRMYEYISAEVVYREDRFEYEYGTDARLRHVPSPDSPHRTNGDLIAAYAVARLKGSAHPIFRVVTRAEVLATRNRSRAKDDGPWVTDEASMWRKTAVHRLWTFLPSSSEMMLADAIETRAETGELLLSDFGETIEADVVGDDSAPSAGVSGIKDKLGVAEPA